MVDMKTGKIIVFLAATFTGTSEKLTWHNTLLKDCPSAFLIQ